MIWLIDLRLASVKRLFGSGRKCHTKLKSFFKETSFTTSEKFHTFLFESKFPEKFLISFMRITQEFIYSMFEKDSLKVHLN